MTGREMIIGASMYRPVGNYNVYDYFRLNTAQYGEYTLFSHRSKEHKNTEFIADIEALAAYYKKDLGFKRGDVFTVFLPTSIEAMILFLALNKIGVIVNFALPALPPDLLCELMDFTHSKGIAITESTDKAYYKLIHRKGMHAVLCTPDTYAVDDKYSVDISNETKAALEQAEVKYISYGNAIKKYSGCTVQGVKRNSSDIAVYMNGGGTTGKSRTIKLSNYALNSVVFMVGLNDEKPPHPGYDTDIGCMPFFHAYGLCVGGLTALHRATKLVLMSKFDADEFIDIMKHNNVIQFCGVPNMYKKLYSHPEWDGPHLSSLRSIFSGGDDVGADFLKKFNTLLEKHGAVARIQQGYGLTECGAVCISNPVYYNKDGSIGRPLNGLIAEIWDEENEPLPDNEVGEIVLSGPSLMEGYLSENGPKDMGLYTDETGRKWIKTGDLGYRDSDGFYFFRGRKKRIIIISGYNVYPRDIEHLLQHRLDFIQECCAVQGYDKNGKILVRLYTVLSPDADENKKSEYNEKITALCGAKLSRFSVPREIVYIKALPRTRVQKVDFMRMTQYHPDDAPFTEE